jgi:hypothetical protein
MVGIAAGVATGLAGLQTWRLGNAQEEIGELSAKVIFQVTQTEQAVDVNETLNGTIDEIAGNFAALVERHRLDQVERDRVVAARDEDLAAARATARRLEGERDAIFRDDMGCAEMGGIRVDRVCGLVAVQLRLRSTRDSGSDHGPNGRSPGGGNGAGPDAVDSADSLPAIVRF